MNIEYINKAFQQPDTTDVNIKIGEQKFIGLPKIPLIKDTEDVFFEIGVENENISSTPSEEEDGLSLPPTIQITGIKSGDSIVQIHPLDAYTGEIVEGIDPFVIKIHVED